MSKDKPALIEARPEMLSTIANSDRTEWTYDMYVSAGEEAVQIRGYGSWILGMLASEVEPKRGELKEFAKDIHASYAMVRVYKHVYEKIVGADPDFVPDGFFPFEVLKMAASTEDPIKTLEELKDKGIATIPGAYREIKTSTTGIEVPKKPSVVLKWDEEKKKWKLKMNPDDLPKIDWSDVSEQLIDYLTKTGK